MRKYVHVWRRKNGSVYHNLSLRAYDTHVRVRVHRAARLMTFRTRHDSRLAPQLLFSLAIFARKRERFPGTAETIKTRQLYSCSGERRAGNRACMRAMHAHLFKITARRVAGRGNCAWTQSARGRHSFRVYFRFLFKATAWTPCVRSARLLPPCVQLSFIEIGCEGSIEPVVKVK